ncbi:hypothetical protein GCM10010521_47070 [Streptomyces rameus]|uniref:Uncharacterized protein n=1 Tax=Streptomyces rameus TaxID=68261 RepID=A0ABP6NN84_9ACTN
MAPPSLPRPLHRRLSPAAGLRRPARTAPEAGESSLVEVAFRRRAADAVARPGRIPDGGQLPHRLPATARVPGRPRGERAGRLPGPHGPDLLASGVHSPAPPAVRPWAPPAVARAAR